MPPSQPLPYAPPSQPLPYAPPSQPPSYTLPGQPPPGMTLNATFASFMRLFGASADPASVQPTNAIQRRFRENLPQYATNPIAGAIAGAVAAVIACIVLNFVFSLILSAVAGPALSSSGSAVNQILGSGLLNLIALEHHASLTASSNVLAVISVSGTITVPVTLLLVFPAVSLALGGYISASTDYSNQLRYVLTRAAAVGPVYGVLLTLIVAAFGTQKVGTSSDITNSVIVLSASWPSLLLYSMLWGTLFTLIGGAIKIFGSRWRVGSLAYLLGKPRGMVTASLTGALAALGTGILISLPLVAFGLGVVDVQQRFPAELAAGQAGSSSGLTIVLLLLLALPASVILLALGSGASLGSSGATSGALFSQSASSGTGDVSLFSLGASNHLAYLLLLIPIIAYFVGGRVAVRVLNSNEPGKPLQAGALVGIWSAVLMLVLGAISGVSLDINVGAAGTSSLGDVTFGLNAGSTFLATLILGCAAGALGAVVKPRRRARRNPMFWLRLAVMLSVALAVGALLLAGVVLTVAPLPEFKTLTTYVALVCGALLAIPTLCYAIALIQLIGYLPPGSEQLANSIAPGPSVGGAPISAVMASASYQPMTPPPDRTMPGR